MPEHVNDFIEILAVICDKKGLKCAVSNSLKGGLLTGATAAIGGLLLGPVGLAIGGAIGGTAAAVTTSQKFQPVAVVLKNMSQREKTALYNKILHALRNFGVQDISSFLLLLATQRGVQDLLLKEITNYVSHDLGLRIC